MIIYPAIDLRHGQCIRLFQGDYQQATVYSEDPLSVAQRFVMEGAKWIHVVDLDGAKNPAAPQTALIKQLINATDANIQTGGGIRSKKQIDELLAAGAARVIVGSAAVQKREEAKTWFQQFDVEKIVLALDIKMVGDMPMVAFDAWQHISDINAIELLQFYQDVGVKHVLCTNVAHDGTLSGPDYSLYRLLHTAFPSLCIQASGGIRSLTDLKQLQNASLNGAIIGRALYENKLSLKEVFAC